MPRVCCYASRLLRAFRHGSRLLLCRCRRLVVWHRKYVCVSVCVSVCVCVCVCVCRFLPLLSLYRSLFLERASERERECVLGWFTYQSMLSVCLVMP